MTETKQPKRKMIRVQILITEYQQSVLREMSAKSGNSVAAIIRNAVEIISHDFAKKS